MEGQNPKPKTVGLPDRKTKTRPDPFKINCEIGWMYTVTDVTITSTLAKNMFRPKKKLMIQN